MLKGNAFMVKQLGHIGKSKRAGVVNSQDFTYLWIGKTAGQKGGCPKCPKCDCDIVLLGIYSPMYLRSVGFKN